MLTKVARPVSIKFCVDLDFLEYSIVLGFISGEAGYENLTEKQVQWFLNGPSTESTYVMTLEKLDEIVVCDLGANKKTPTETTRMQNLFTNFHKIFTPTAQSESSPTSKGGGSALTLRDQACESSRKTRIIYLFLLTFAPKTFQRLPEHAVKLLEAFQIVDSGSPSNFNINPKKHKNNNKLSHSGN